MVLAEIFCYGFLIVYILAFWWAYTSPTHAERAELDNSTDGDFFYASMWQDMNSD